MAKNVPRRPKLGRRWWLWPSSVLRDVALPPAGKYWLWWIREIAYTDRVMRAAGYNPTAQDPFTKAPIPGGDWYALDERPGRQELEDWYGFWAKALGLAGSGTAPGAQQLAGRVWDAWHRFEQIGGAKGQALAGSSGETMGELFDAWRGPRPKDLEPSPWYVQAWPVWVALGLYVLAGTRER